jgi:aminoglycoside phosphotransferase (APT) family kinase protein
MIPQEKSAAVTRALRDAFGVAEFEDIRRLTKGTSSAVFRIVVRGCPYVLKFILRTSDPGRKIACMTAAADAGLAPRVWYTSIPDRIAITDFVEAVPFPVTDGLLRMPAVLRALHGLTRFPTVPDHLNTTCMFLMNEGAAVDGLIRNFREANIVPEDESEELFTRYAQMADVYPRHDPDLVSSHNDLFKPDNILFDGRRVWLVDWEAAFLNDRYADLAVVANLVVSNEEEESAYLQEYFGKPPDPYQAARFFLMQQLAHMFYGMVFLLQGASGKPLHPNEPAPEFEDFHRRFWAGEVELSDQQMKAEYGRVHWERLLRNIRRTRFDEALEIVAARGEAPRSALPGDQPL